MRFYSIFNSICLQYLPNIKKFFKIERFTIIHIHIFFYVGIANIAVTNAELDVINTKNQLRKEIEQACVNVASAKSQYTAGLEQIQSSQESYDVTNEKFKVGLLNSVDFLVQKTSLITSESKLLQSKFNLIFSYKVLDFYKGVPLTL